MFHSLSSDCSHHHRSQACALCIIFSLLFLVHPASCSNSALPAASNNPQSASTAHLHSGDLTGGGVVDPPRGASEPSGGDVGGGYKHLLPGGGAVSGSQEQLASMKIFLKKIFDKYGEDGVMTFDGFQKLLKHLDVGTVPAAPVGQTLGESITRHVPGGQRREHHTGDYDDYEYHDKDGGGHDSHEGHDHEGHDHEGHDYEGHDHEGHDHEGHDHEGHDHEGHDHEGHDTASDLSNAKHPQRDQQHGGAEQVSASSTQRSVQKPLPGNSELDSSRRATAASVIVTDAGHTAASLAEEQVNAPVKASSHDVQVTVEPSSSGVGSKNSSSSSSSVSSREMPPQPTQQGKQGDSLAKFRTRRLTSVKSNRPLTLTDSNTALDIPTGTGGHHGIKDRVAHRVHRRHPMRHRPQHANRNNGHQRVPAHDRAVSHDRVVSQDGVMSQRSRRDVSEPGTELPLAKQQQPVDRHEQCLSPSFLLSMHNIDSEAAITQDMFLLLCPALIQQIDSRACTQPRPFPLGLAHDHVEDADHGHDHDHDHNDTDVKAAYHVSQVSGEVWGYAFLAVFVISLVGLLSVALVPIMQKVFYNHLLQFLVALAVGTLTGDALLHLIPHALGSHGEGTVHEHTPGDRHAGTSSHLQGVFRGLVVLSGVYFFFLMERLMGIISTWRRTSHHKKIHSSGRNSHPNSPKLYRTVEEHESEVGAKLSKHSDVVTSCEEIVMVVHPGKDVRNMAEDMHDELHRDCEPEEREQLNHSHGAHGHSHGPLPSSIAAVAWMVIMGDGLHNFSDGLAIGAAFASGLSGGISTSVAVFCHELPHEIGDFAVLLRAGMSVKQAMVYNLVSSILCVFGMIVGVCVGNIGSVSLWVFALAGGMFIYIALVDMLPELTAVAPRKGENPLVHLALQNAGMLVGAGIMALIAVYEDKIALAL